MNNRLQKKCFVAATGFHLLLLAVLLFGSAFFSRQDAPRDLQMVDIIPANLIDAAFVGGGTPNAKPPPPAPPQPKPPTPTPETNVKPPPQPEQEVKPPKPAPDSFEVKPDKPRKPEINLKPVVRETGKPVTKPENKPNASDDSREIAKKREAVSSALRVLKSDLSPGTTVGIPGAGGEAYAGYENVIQSIYQRRYDQELPSAGDVADKRMEVGVSVTIARDGTVVSSRIIEPSANAALNKLVQRVLEKVTFIAPFPQKSKDQQRTFNIIFDLKPKKAPG